MTSKPVYKLTTNFIAKSANVIYPKDGDVIILLTVGIQDIPILKLTDNKNINFWNEMMIGYNHETIITTKEP